MKDLIFSSDGLNLLISISTLFGIIFGVYKFINRANDDNVLQGQRIDNVEAMTSQMKEHTVSSFSELKAFLQDTLSSFDAKLNAITENQNKMLAKMSETDKAVAVLEKEVQHIDKDVSNMRSNFEKQSKENSELIATALNRNSEQTAKQNEILKELMHKFASK